MSVLLEGVLDEELDEELGYSKYDYHNKETDNSRNGLELSIFVQYVKPTNFLGNQ